MESGDERYPWASWSDAKLLGVRLCDLGVTVQNSPLLERVAELRAELRAAGVRRFRVPVWLSDEWFSPDGVPGLAIPFYLAHPRLARLERRQMGEVEGGTRRECMKILRHEAGHAVCTAYRLHRRKRWRELFGRFDEPYPETYKPRPASRGYVTHLDRWYAQAHPAEDWAETFAVWVTPGSRWRKQYAGWAAVAKLEYVDAVISEVGEVVPPVPPARGEASGGGEVGSLDEATQTLGEHYRDRKEHYGTDYPDVLDRDLLAIFDPPKVGTVGTVGGHRRGEPAASFLRRLRPTAKRDVARFAHTHGYTVDQVLLDMIGRSRQLGLRVRGDHGATLRDCMLMVAAGTMRCLLTGHARVAV